MIGAVLPSAPRPGGAPSGTAPEGPEAGAAVDRLERLGAGRTVLVPGADLSGVLAALAAVLREAADDVLVVPADLVVHEEALAELVLDPRRRTAAAVTRGGRDVRRGAGRVVSAASPVHRVSRPDAGFVGAIGVAKADLPASAAALDSMRDAAAAEAWTGDPAAFFLVALIRGGVPVSAVDLDPWPWARPRDDAEAVAAEGRLRELDPAAVRLARASRPDDGFYSTFVVRKLSRRLTAVALRLGRSPNEITVASLGVGLLAAVAFAIGSRAGLVLGALLLQASLVVDCVDGEVARYTRRFTPFGAWLDASTDRIKEYACYAGLAFGATGEGNLVWLAAAAMLTLQTARHTSDYTFTFINGLRSSPDARLPMAQLDDGVAPDRDASAAERALRASERSNERPAVMWAKRVAHLPIGERWLVISLTAMVGTPLFVFVVLLCLAAAAFAYTAAGRLIRSRTWSSATRSARREGELVRAEIDGGVLAAAVSRIFGLTVPVGRFAWLLPSVTRLLEYSAVITMVWAGSEDAMPAAFALLFVVAYHHYDILYRLINNLPLDAVVQRIALGAEGRVLVIGVLALLGPTPLAVGLTAMAAVLAVLFVGHSLLEGMRARSASGGDRLAVGVPGG